MYIFHVNRSGGNQLAVGYTSLSIAFATIIAILTYHIFQQVRNTKLCKKLSKVFLKFNILNIKQDDDDLNALATCEDTSNNVARVVRNCHRLSLT